MLECPHGVTVNLARVWRDRFGFAPPFGNGAVSGSHFALREGGRGVVIAQPNRLHVDGAVLAQVCALVGAKHCAEAVRLAKPEEVPKARVPERLPTERDLATIEEWPVAVEHDEPLVAEYLSGTGAFVGNQTAHWFAATDLDDAMTFAGVDDAEAFLKLHALQHHVVLRFVAGCLAEQDQRETALFNV